MSAAEIMEIHELQAPQFSDDAIAEVFIRKHADDMRYIAKWNKWFLWDGHRWVEDERMRAFDEVRIVCREAAISAAAANASNHDNLPRSIASAKTVAAVQRLAQANPCLSASVNQWDTNIWALNTPDGIVDLKSGRMRPTQPDDYVTKSTAVSPDPLMPATRWFAFLDEITGGDKALQSYLQRAAGYCLTGSTQEHSLFFFYGTGRNGKSVFLKVLSGILGDYASAAGSETFTASKDQRHLTEMARLRGARLVVANETEQGKQWNESRIKQVTSGDPVVANFMRQDLFEYVPQFKLLIAGNHRPRLSSVDEAMRARFHLVPFTITVPVDKRDPDLDEKLKKEWPAILQWMIDGCVAWRNERLDPPDAVKNATRDYLESQDAIEAWIAERCDRSNREAWASEAELFASWADYADASGEHAGTKRGLIECLVNKSFEKKRRAAGNGILGLFVKPICRDDGMVV